VSRGPEHRGWSLFETPLGTFAAAWSDTGLTRVRLPARDEDELVASLARDLGGAVPEAPPPSQVSRDLEAIAGWLAGLRPDLRKVSLDFAGVSPFHRLVYQAARELGRGEVVSYGELAALAGSPRAARAVGQAMARNRWAIVVPCHRVVASGGKPGGFNCHGGLDLKAQLLALEGASLPRSGGAARARELPYDAEEAVAYLQERDPVLGRWIDKVGGFGLELRGDGSPYHHLTRAIVYQQLSGKAAGTIHGRLLDLFPRRRLPKPAALLEVPTERLRSAGLSRAKTAAIQDLAARTLDGTVPGRAEAAAMSDEALIDRLTAVRGVGRWTVEMYLMFGLGRPDVLAVDDLGLRKGAARIARRKELPTPDQLRTRGKRWAPYRSVASWFLWRICEL
jgi:methylated-DNA-[protein]-cysteine S-methyltransferase